MFTRDQRLTATVVYILLGVSVLMAPVLKKVPFAVLFGVFLYMGVSGLQGLQLFDRAVLILRPVKHHPRVSYVHQVKLGKMVLFTFLQIAGLALLWLVKSFPDTALLFPFFIVLMIPYRFLFKYIFTEAELNAVSNVNLLDTPAIDVEINVMLRSWMAQMQDLWSLLMQTKAKVTSTGGLFMIYECYFR